MKTLKVIYFKPNHEQFDEYVTSLKKISPVCYICSRYEVFITILVENSIEALISTQIDDLEWLDQHEHMLQEYSPEEGHSLPYPAFIDYKPIITMCSIK